jgi:hypothetical protein
MTWSQTFRSLAFDYVKPTPGMVCIEDIAHHLANICRFRGACICFYSVAQHSVLLAQLVPPELRKPALLHDSPEAYLDDWPRPLKVAMKQLGVLAGMEKLYDSIAEVIGVKFGVELVNLAPEIKHADNVMLATEKRDLMGPPPMPWVALPDPLLSIIEPWSPERAELEFLRAWDSYA